jgi:hypothetical protein
MDISIAEDLLYNSSFESETIGRSVRPGIHAELGPVGGTPFRRLDRFRRFAAERLAGSSWTQKTLDRAFKGLSNGIKYIDIRPIINKQSIFLTKLQVTKWFNWIHLNQIVKGIRSASDLNIQNINRSGMYRIPPIQSIRSDADASKSVTWFVQRGIVACNDSFVFPSVGHVQCCQISLEWHKVHQCPQGATWLVKS